MAVGNQQPAVSLADEDAEFGRQADGEDLFRQVMAVPQPAGEVHADDVALRRQSQGLQHGGPTLRSVPIIMVGRTTPLPNLRQDGVRHLRAVDGVDAQGEVRAVVFQRPDRHEDQRALVAALAQLAGPQPLVTRLEFHGDRLKLWILPRRRGRGLNNDVHAPLQTRKHDPLPVHAAARAARQS